MKKRLILVLALALALTLCLTACGDTWDAAIFYTSCADPYTAAIRSTLDQALTDAEIPYANYCCEYDPAVQRQQIAEAVAGGCNLLIVNCAAPGDAEMLQAIMDAAGDLPVIFFGSDADYGDTLDAYENACFIGTDADAAAHLQGHMIGAYLLANFDTLDLNGDSVLTYAMLRGDGSTEAAYRTQYAIEDADAILTAAGRIALSYFDCDNHDKYQLGDRSADTASSLMAQNLSAFTEANGGMIELVICNDDTMAQGAVQALNAAGYNRDSSTVIPVFGFGAGEDAKALIADGKMTGTIDPHTDAIAAAIANAAAAFKDGTTATEAVTTAAAADPALCAIAYNSDNWLYITSTAYTG